MDDTAVEGHLHQNRTANPTTPRSDEQARDHGLATYGFKVAVFPRPREGRGSTNPSFHKLRTEDMLPKCHSTPQQGAGVATRGK